MVQSRRLSCMGLNSNAALVPANNLFEKTNKFAHIRLDDGPSMLVRARATVGIHWVWFHMVFFSRLVSWLHYLLPFSA